MPVKRARAKGEAGKKGAVKSSSKKRPEAGNSPGYFLHAGEDEAPVIVKGGPQGLGEEGIKGWTLLSWTPLDFVFNIQSSPQPNIYSQSGGEAITGFVVINVRTGQEVFCYDSSVEGNYEIIFGSPMCKG